MKKGVVVTCAFYSALLSLMVGCFSLYFDTTEWYGAVGNITILLPLAVIIRHNGYNFRGLMHFLLIVAALLYFELMKGYSELTWNLIAEPEQHSSLLFTYYAFRGLGTFCKLLPSAKVLSEIDNRHVSVRDYAGWVISFLACASLTQSWLFYLTASVLIEWQWKNCLVESIFWAGLSLSSSSYCQDSEHVILIGCLLPILANYLCIEYTYEY